MLSTVAALFIGSSQAVGAEEELPTTDVALFGDFPDVQPGTTYHAEQLINMGLDMGIVDAYMSGTVPEDNQAPTTDPNTQPEPGWEEDTGEGTSSSATTTAAAAYPVNQIMSAWVDRFRYRNLIRRGYYDAARDRGFGFDKVYWKHNLTVGAVRATTRGAQVRYPIGGTTYNYEADVLRIRCTGSGWARTCKAVEKRVVIAGHDFRTNTPDGLAFGIVTAFCRGSIRCPDWVKNAANA